MAVDRITHRERSRWLATLDADRADWMKCRPGCPECNGYGWAVFDGQDVQRDDTCNAFPSDVEARDAATFYLSHARSILEGIALGRLSWRDAQLLAEAMVGPAVVEAIRERPAPQDDGKPGWKGDRD